MFGSLGRVGLNLGTTFTPASLFYGGEQGVWYDPSDFSTMFQDSAGTTPVTAVEQPVGLILDKSGRGNHASQSTLASRPTLAARYNFLTYSEDLSNPAWIKFNSTISADATTAPDGTATADKIVGTAVSASHSTYYQVSTVNGVAYTFTVYVKAAEYVNAAVTMQSAFPATTVVINLSTGALSVGQGSPISYSSTNVGNGWWRVTMSVAANATVTAGGATIVQPLNGTTWADRIFLGNGVSGIYAWGADFRPSAMCLSTPPYQRIAAATDYDTTGFPLYLRFDGTDDSLVTSSNINFSTTDKMSVFIGLRKLSDANYQQLVGNSDSGLGSNFFETFINSGSTGKYFLLANGTTGSPRATTDSVTTTPNTDILTVTYDLANGTTQFGAKIDGVASTLSYSATGATTGAFGNTPLYIGARGSTFRFNGHLYGLIVRGAQSTAAQITSAESWLNQKAKAY